MEIILTDNISRKLVNSLDSALSRARKVRLAVAFVKYSGFVLIEESLNECLRNGGQVEFLIGLDFRITEPKVLRTLLQLSHNGFPLKCYCFSDPAIQDTPVYHPKLYLMSNDEEATIAIGSSNLTSGGLKDNVEVNIVLTAPLEEEVVSDAYSLYNSLKFKQRRFEPDLEYIDKYEEAYKRVQRKSTQALREEKTRRLIRELREREKTLPKPTPRIQELVGWQKIVYERLPSGVFRTRDMYVYEEEFRKYYPENRHVRDKIRQILQQLRDIGLIKSLRRETWVKI